jgi:hypothetical protein
MIPRCPNFHIYQQNLFIHPIASIEVGDDPSSSQTSPVEERFLWGLYCMVKNNRPDLFLKATTLSTSLDERRSGLSEILRDVAPMGGWWFQVPTNSLVHKDSELGSLSSLLQMPVDLLKACLT